MSKGDLTGILMFGRKIKPVALGFTFLMLVYIAYDVFQGGVFDSNIFGDIIAVVSAAAAVMLVGGWWGQNQRLAEYGLLASVFVFLLRTFFLLFSKGLSEPVMQGFAVCVIAVGAYMLEKSDEKGEGSA